MELAQRYREDSQDFDSYDNRWNEDEIVPNTPPGSLNVSAIMRGDTSRNGDFYIHSFTYHILNTNGTLELRLGTVTRRITVLNREVIMRQDTEHFQTPEEGESRACHNPSGCAYGAHRATPSSARVMTCPDRP